MSRIKLLAASPRRALAALATVLVAVGLTAASGANFSAQSANPGNTFTAGTLSMSNSLDNAAILTASNMRPGDPATKGKVDIQNTGSLSGAFTLSRSALTDSDTTNPLSGKLNVVIADCGVWSGGSAPSCAGATTKYTGTLANLTSAVNLSTFTASEKHRYQFSVTLDPTADNSYQGDSSTATFAFNAV
jgi:spore coat-associated protein N